MPKFNLFRKMIVILVVLLIPIIVLYFFSNKTSTNVLREELKNTSRDQLNFFQQQIDTTIHSISQWPNLLIYDPDISALKDIPRKKSDYLDLETIELVKRIQQKLSIQENSVNWVSQLTIYSPLLGRVITSSKVYPLDEKQLSNLSVKGWQMTSFNSDKSKREHLFSLFTVSPFSSSKTPEASNLVLEVQFSSSNIEQLLDAFRGKGQNNPFYYVNNGEFIYTSTADVELVKRLMEHVSLDMLENSHYETVKLDGESYLVNMERSTTTGWVLIDYWPISEMMLPIKKSNILFYISVATLLIMASVVIYSLYAQVQVPIRQLVTSFQRVKNEDYNVRIQPKGNTEFTFLFNRFNSMVSQIQELFQRSYLEQLHIREAKLKQLQSQINPHFFYNCFSYISSMAKLQNYTAIIAMSQNLSHYYRYTTRQEKELVPLQEELKFIRHYLDISVMRMNRLHYEIQVPDEMLSVMIPPLSIQPLVENAMLHGIERLSTAGKIRIHATRDQDRYIVTVEDDGKGMNEGEIVALSKRLNYPMQEDMGCGLWNVHQRLTLRYGEQAGIVLQHSKLGGLSVSISWAAENETSVIETSAHGTSENETSENETKVNKISEM